MGILTEWSAFMSLAESYLGLPIDAALLYSPLAKWNNKSHRILSYILRIGNFGNKRDGSYHDRYPLIVSKMISWGRLSLDTVEHSFIFPKDSFVVWWRSLKTGVLPILCKICK